MKKYDKLSDEELIRLWHRGEENVMDYIMEKYKDAVRRKAKTMYLIGGDSDDLIQEGMIGLFKAIRDFKEGKEASFASFANLCITRQIYTAVQASKRQKHMPLNHYISFYASSNTEEKDQALLEELTSEKERNPEELMIDRENYQLLERLIRKKLSKFEQEVLELYLSGLSYGEIANVLKKSPKSTDNALQRIKNKLKVEQDIL